MRGLASGFGGRISSMGLLISTSHRANHAFDVHDLVLSDVVLLIQHLICPGPIPRLLRNPGVGRPQSMLGNLPQRHKEAKKTSAVVTRETLSLTRRLKR